MTGMAGAARTDHFSQRIQRLRLPERSESVGMGMIAAERSLDAVASKHPDALDLSHADTRRFPPPAWFQEAFNAAVREGSTAFTPPRGDAGARARVAPGISRWLGVEVDPELELALTPGSQGGLFTALSVLARGGDEQVMLADPEYLLNERLIRFLGAGVRHVRIRPSSGSAALDLDEVERGFRAGARCLLFSNPSNPTGAMYGEETLAPLAELVQRCDGVVIVDELYGRLVYDDAAAFEHLIAYPGMRDHCITLLGPSKTECMTGYRIGCLVGPPALVTAVEDVLDIVAIRAPSYAQHALASWLVEDDDWTSSRVREYRALRDVAVAALEAMPGVEVHAPPATAYLFPNVERLGIGDVELARILIEEAQVIVRPGISFGPAGRGHFRMCYAQDEDALVRGLERMAVVMERLATDVAPPAVGTRPTLPKER